MVDPLRCSIRRDRTGLDAPLCGGDNGGLTVGDTTVLDMMDVEKEHEYGRDDLNFETRCHGVDHREWIDPAGGSHTEAVDHIPAATTRDLEISASFKRITTFFSQLSI